MDNPRIYQPHKPFGHSLDIQSRFSDYDMFGHINNNSMLAYFDLGKSEYFNAIMGHTCNPTDLCAVIVNINVDFLLPATAGEQLCVQTLVDHVGDRSFRLYQRIVNPVTNDIKAQATTTLAGFDPATQGPAPLLDSLVAAL